MTRHSWTVAVGSWAGCLVAGCAGGPSVRAGGPELLFEQRGNEFHERREASTPAGDRITGQVCGMDIVYAVSRDEDNGARLDGFLDGRIPTAIDVRDVGRSERHITGHLGTEAGAAVVDLQVGPERLDGRVGFRYFHLRRDGNDLRGPLQISQVPETSDAIIHGALALVAMPAVDQAAVLPSLLTCFVQRLGTTGLGPLVVTIGGPGGAAPRDSSALYSHF